MRHSHGFQGGEGAGRSLRGKSTTGGSQLKPGVLRARVVTVSQAGGVARVAGVRSPDTRINVKVAPLATQDNNQVQDLAQAPEVKVISTLLVPFFGWVCLAESCPGS